MRSGTVSGSPLGGREAGGHRSTAPRSSGFTPKVVWLRRAFGRWRRPSATGGGRRRILHRETSRYRRTWKRRWRRMPAPAGRSSSWTGRTDSPSCIGCTMRRSLRPANGGSETFSGCWREGRPRSGPSNPSPPTQSLHSLQILLEISDRHIQRRPTPGISRLKESHHVGHPAVLDRAPRGIVVPGYQTVRMVGLELEARATHPIQLALDRHDLAGCVTPGPETRYHRSTRSIYQLHLLAIVVQVGAGGEEAALERDTELVGGGGAAGWKIEGVGVQDARKMHVDVEREHRDGMRCLLARGPGDV